MKKQYNRIRLAAAVLLAAALCLGGPASAMAAEPGALSATEQNELDLYFGVDQLVEVATRAPKPLAQIAENVTIITAAQIEAMNAHTIAEVLNRVPGVFIDFANDLSGKTSTLIQGSDYEHVLVLVDGVRWGYVNADYADTKTIPVQIVKRIEIIKGPGSSTWGSALGGVVNIITKDVGNSTVPYGSIVGSYGTENSMDFRGDAAGTVGPISYYIYGGRQETDGLVNDQFYENNNFYGKFAMPLPWDASLHFSVGYAHPEQKYSQIPAWDFELLSDDEVLFYTASLDKQLSQRLAANITASSHTDKLIDSSRSMATKVPYDRYVYDATTQGIRSRLVWSQDNHVVVAGVDYERIENTDAEEVFLGEAVTNFDENWAVYANDTIRHGNLTIIPGIRYDHLGNSDNIINPSMGLTYLLNNTTLFRGAIVYGFRKPAIVLKKQSLSIFPFNPDLQSETVTSFQAGIETTAVRNMKLKLSLFAHNATDVWDTDLSGAQMNGGDTFYRGIEVEMKTASFHNFSLGANYTRVNIDPETEDSDDLYNIKLLFEYDDHNSWQAQLSGNLVWWGTIFSNPAWTFPGSYDAMIWDFNVNKKIWSKDSVETVLFFKAHNLFDGSQYIQSAMPNSERWLEGGLRIKY